MKPSIKQQQALLWPVALAVALYVPISTAATKSWRTLKIPDCFSAWTLARSPTGVYVGGAGTDLAPGVWRYQHSRWTRIFDPETSVGTVNAIAADQRGYINATMQGVTYDWSSEVMAYDPAAMTWALRGVGNASVYSALLSAGNALLYAGIHQLQVPAVWPEVGVLGGFYGTTRFGSFLYEAKGFNTLAADPYAGIHVAGLYADTAPPTVAGRPGFWHYSSSQFRAIDLPAYLAEITAITSDGNGVIYLAATDANDDGRVWRYSSDGALTDTGLDAEQVKALATDAQGRIYAGGIDGNLQGQVWRYAPKTGKWTSLRLKKSAYVNALGVSENGATIYTIGGDALNVAKLWIYR